MRIDFTRSVTKRTPVDVTVVVPTVNEAPNISSLIPRIFETCLRNGIRPEVIVVDDGSTDGTPEAVVDLSRKFDVRLLRRPERRGITSALLDGFSLSSAGIVGAMDADLSHPPEKIPDMVRPIMDGSADMTIGSRYTAGGQIEEWPIHRRVISGIATLLARPISGVRDPMSGFFFVRRELVKGRIVPRRGWKICLEIVVRANPKRVVEVPYTFVGRSRGRSKLGTGVILRFVRQIVSLYLYRLTSGTIKKFLKFCLVGGLGVPLNLAIVYALVEYAKLWYLASAIVSFFLVTVNNFFWNKVWTFGDLRFDRSIVVAQLAKYVSASLLALGINVGVLWVAVELLGFWYLLGQLAAILVAVFATFTVSSRWVFLRLDND